MTKREVPITNKNFGETESAPKGGQKPEQSGNKDNNSTVSGHLPCTTELRTSPPGPEMALKTGRGHTPINPDMSLQSRRNIWPMTELRAGQVTEMEGAQPITEQPQVTDQKCGDIRRPSDQNEIGDSEGCEPNIL